MSSAARAPHRPRSAKRIFSQCVTAAILTMVGACTTYPMPEGRTTGDLRLEYAMPQVQGRNIPYRVFLPSTWTPEREWPLIVILHGYAANSDTPFEQAGGALQAEAERLGFVIVSPNGYNGMADYGANLPLPSGLSRYGVPLATSPEQESALAEADVLNVLATVENSYNIDRKRIFLMGNSMGMTGTLHLANKFQDRFCGISPSGGPPWPNYPMESLTSLAGAYFVHGDRDDTARLDDTMQLYRRALDLGINARMMVVPGGNHATGWVQSIPEVLRFFSDLRCEG